MPEWLQAAPAGGAGAWTNPTLLAWRIGVALAFGAAVAALHRRARKDEAIPPTFSTTLILLAAVIAMATQVIGDNVARAFSLVGALSVVRFRTVVKDTQDAAFVIFAVVVGMASGADQPAVPLVGLPLIALASVLFRAGRRPNGREGFEGLLTCRVPVSDPVRAALDALLAASTTRAVPASASSARRGSALDLGFLVRLRPGSSPAEFVAELSKIEGVQDVELRRDD